MSEQPLRTINDVLRSMRELDRPDAVLRHTNGEWQQVSARQMHEYVRRAVSLLRSWGVRKGDRVAIIGENRIEWAIADFACLAIGAIDVPIYPTLTEEQTAFILQNSGTRLAFVSTAKQAQKVRSATGIPLEHLVAMEDAVPGAESFWKLLDSTAPLSEAEFASAVDAVAPDDLATIIYTSGTTGTPKGVMLTHGNIASNMNYSVHDFGWIPGMRVVSFLPLSHITARHVDYCFYRYGVSVAYCSSMDQLLGAFSAIKPSIVVAVPRVYEKVRQEAIRKAGGGIKRRVFDWALRQGARQRDAVLRGRCPSGLLYGVADKLVLSKIRAVFGGEVQHFVSGGAPLGVETPTWYADAGIRIFEGYGLTETSPVIAVNTVKEYKLGTVGKPLANVECRIAADGELLVRGPSVFLGYWQSPDESAAAFEEGWFKTGDIGAIDSDGFLSITDRKKDLLKTSGGKFIAPQPIENRVKQDPLVGHAVLLGDRRKFATVLISPNFPLLEEWATNNEVPYSSRAELVQHPDVRATYEAIVRDVNSGLAQFETMKRVILVPDEFTVDTGELTPSLKLKRRVVEARYQQQIERVYADAEQQGAAAPVRP